MQSQFEHSTLKLHEFLELYPTTRSHWWDWNSGKTQSRIFSKKLNRNFPTILSWVNLQKPCSGQNLPKDISLDSSKREKLNISISSLSNSLKTMPKRPFHASTISCSRPTTAGTLTPITLHHISAKRSASPTFSVQFTHNIREHSSFRYLKRSSWSTA